MRKNEKLLTNCKIKKDKNLTYKAQESFKNKIKDRLKSAFKIACILINSKRKYLR